MHIIVSHTHTHAHAGLDATAADVANLVAQAFAKPPAAAAAPDTQAKPQRADGSGLSEADQQMLAGMAPPGVLSHLLRMFGLDGSKLGAMAVNGIILMAQMVSEGAYVLALYMRQNLWDWWVILEYVVKRVRESQQGGQVQLMGAGT